MSDEAGLDTGDDRLTVTGVLDFDTVMPLESRGIDWLKSAAPVRVTLDLSAVTYSNSAGVALLLSWLRTARAAGKELVIENMPADLHSMVGLGGLEDLLTS